jgi:hypothetical protein
MSVPFCQYRPYNHIVPIGIYDFPVLDLEVRYLFCEAPRGWYSCIRPEALCYPQPVEIRRGDTKQPQQSSTDRFNSYPDISNYMSTVKDIEDRKVSCPMCGHPSMKISELDDAQYQCFSCKTPLRVKIVGDVIIPLEGVEGKVERMSVPESPRHRRDRFISEYDVGEETASKLTTKLNVADFYESVAEDSDAEVAATFVVDTLLGELNYRDMDITDVKTSGVTNTIEALAEDSVTWRSVTEIIRDALDEGQEIDTVFKDRDVEKTEDSELDEMVAEVIEDEQEAVEDYLSGAEEALNHLVGKVMARTNGQADAKRTRELFETKLDGET